jgi:hypothetical protein
VQPQFNVVFAQGAKGLFQMDFLAIELDIELGLELIDDHTGCDRSEEFAVFASFDLNVGGQFGDALGQFVHGVIFMRFTLGAALSEDFQSSFIGAGQRDGQTLRNKIIAGVTSSDFNVVGFGAQAHDLLR